MANVFQKMGLPQSPVILAPLAGVSDSPFRRICTEKGADLTYVEMLSAVALNHQSKKTFDIMRFHESEKILGVQVTSPTPEDMEEAVRYLDQTSYATIDINMGCPVKKVVKTGCGSGILKDVRRVAETTAAARRATTKPLSVKIRLGWDGTSKNFLEVAKAIEDNGAEWITVHGRTRADDYSIPVDLLSIKELKDSIKIPVIGNGNIMSKDDAKVMLEKTGVDGLMVSRGALGNPWLFNEIKGVSNHVELDDWESSIVKHLAWQKEEFRSENAAAVCMRKHLLWYLKGWPRAKKLRSDVVQAHEIDLIRDMLLAYTAELREEGVKTRFVGDLSLEEGDRFVWDPKWDMDRQMDRGGSDESLE